MKPTKRIKHEARQLLRLCYVDELFDQGRAEHLLRRLLQAKPRGCLAVLVEFEKLVKLERAQHTARVESATPLPAEASSKVRARLEQEYGPRLDLTFVHNPALIGGIRIKVGSDVYDGSVQGRLAALEERFS